jgi:hypothetical protein
MVSKHRAREDSMDRRRSSAGEDLSDAESDLLSSSWGVRATGRKKGETSSRVRGVTEDAEGGRGDRNSFRSRHFCFAVKRPGGLKKPSTRFKALSCSVSRYVVQAVNTAWTAAGRSVCR